MVEVTSQYYEKQITALERRITELEMALDDARSKLMVEQ